MFFWEVLNIIPRYKGRCEDGTYSLVVKLRSVAAAIRVRSPLGTQFEFVKLTVLTMQIYYSGPSQALQNCEGELQGFEGETAARFGIVVCVSSKSFQK